MRFIIVTYLVGAAVALGISIDLERRYRFPISLFTILFSLMMTLMSWFGVMLMLDEYNER